MSWHHTAKARAILAQVRPDDLHVERFTPIVGPDTLVLAFAGAEKLAALRTAFVEMSVGFTFDDSFELGRAEDYLAADRAVPSVQDVLAETFGDPNLYGRDVDAARAHIRAGMTREIGEAA